MIIIASQSKSWNITIRDDADQSVYNEIFKYREYRAADEAIKNAKGCVIDAGAHSGLFSLYCRALNSKVKIFALEPEENNFKLLQKHLKYNKVKGIKALRLALAGETGERELVISADSHNHSIVPLSTGRWAWGEGAPSFIPQGTINVKSYSLSDFCDQYKISVISLLKMDIEGAEYEVVESISKEVYSAIQAIIMEYHRGKNYKVLENKLREHGFGVQVFPSKFDKTMGFIFAKNKQTKSAQSARLKRPPANSSR